MIPKGLLELQATEAIDKTEFLLRRTKDISSTREWGKALTHLKQGLKLFLEHRMR